MKQRLLSAVFLCALANLLVSGARAQNPHFITDSDSLSTVSTDPDDLVTSWKESGLGNDVLISYTASANATAGYACINGGGNHPSASNKETVNGPVSASGTFSSGKNGSISQSLTAEEPSAGNFSCPGGQTLVLDSVSYTNVQLCDTTDGICESLPDVSKTFCDVNNLTKATVKNCLAEADGQ